ncbi:MAG: peptidylprolyl isomerase [Chitinophagaceae bacterium]
MTKHFVAALFALAVAVTAPAQTLFTYGTDSVSVAEFLQAYHKNNAGENSAPAKKQYLDLYIASRLKIKEARERGYHTLPHMQAELADLRQQIMPAYLHDEEGLQKLAAEALLRAQKDIEVSHIFIALHQDGLKDTTAAKQKLADALLQLQQGKPFADVAKNFSDDPSVQTNGGKIGFITAFTLPYELENIVYATAAGQVSKPYLSKSGYHIFKIESERPARGRLRLAQVLLAFPPGADAATEAALKKRADSIYNRLLKGDDFGRLATQFSDDPISAQAGGQLPEVGIGQFDASFENTVYALAKDGAITPPFKTAHGYHIVKRLAHLPAVNNEESLQAMHSRVQASEDRMATLQAALAQKVLQQAQCKKLPFSEAELWAFSDSALDGKREMRRFALTAGTPLFTLGEAKITVADWLQFAQVARFESDGSGIKPHAQVWEAFVAHAALEHYRQNLEAYNPAFRWQLQEFEEGSLFFEIMQRDVWNKAQEDTAALHSFYNAHKQQYVWKKSADAIMVFAPNEAAAKSLQAALAKAPKKWREIVAGDNSGAVADSARTELQQLPGKTSGTLKAGSTTAPVLNSSDGSYAFAYVVKIYNQPAQRSFAEARSQVITDYQTQLEKDWLESLKKKYRISIREKALEMVLSTSDRYPR